MLFSRDEEVEETGDGLTPIFLEVQSRKEGAFSRVPVFGITHLSMIAADEEETVGETQTQRLGGEMLTDAFCWQLFSPQCKRLGHVVRAKG